MLLVSHGVSLVGGGVLGFWLKWILEKRKARYALVTEIAGERVSEYVNLWRITQRAAFGTKDSELDRKQLDDDLFDWYYRNAGAMYLSVKAAKRLAGARLALQKRDSELKEIRRRFSRLRTQLKYDCGVYTMLDKVRKIPPVERYPEAGAAPGPNGERTAGAPTVSRT